MIYAFYKTTSIILRTPHQWNLLPTIFVMALEVIILTLLERYKPMDPNLVTLQAVLSEATSEVTVEENAALKGGTKATWIPSENVLQVPPLYAEDVKRAIQALGSLPEGLQILRFRTEATPFNRQS